MQQETRNCQNCKQNFVIEPDDFNFYEKIKVPAPTWCPECRTCRRLIWRNERILYKNKCAFCDKNMLSICASDFLGKVICNECWWSDDWNPLSYGKEYDFSKPFFTQMEELLLNVPRPNLHNRNSTNCGYCESLIDSKDCYMISGLQSENCLYGEFYSSQDCADSVSIWKSNYVYESGNCNENSHLIHSWFSDSCMDSAFLFDCRGCSFCFGCVGLKNKQYYIFNKPYSKSEYKELLSKWDLGSYHKLQEIKYEFKKFLLSRPHRFASLRNTVDVTGDYVEHAKNCRSCFMTLVGMENSKFVFQGGMDLKDSYDVHAGGGKSELLYEISGSLGCQRIFFL